MIVNRFGYSKTMKRIKKFGLTQKIKTLLKILFFGTGIVLHRIADRGALVFLGERWLRLTTGVMTGGILVWCVSELVRSDAGVLEWVFGPVFVLIFGAFLSLMVSWMLSTIFYGLLQIFFRLPGRIFYPWYRVPDEVLETRRRFFFFTDLSGGVPIRRSKKSGDLWSILALAGGLWWLGGSMRSGECDE